MQKANGRYLPKRGPDQFTYFIRHQGPFRPPLEDSNDLLLRIEFVRKEEAETAEGFDAEPVAKKSLSVPPCPTKPLTDYTFFLFLSASRSIQTATRRF
ncbi:hypothetical protein C5167_012098 [Papaver somniferum]|uniref:Uncharacterized protein n=1 Tax=Papaver somniferum TaxID=3469 RepID=A0A4Y7IZP1_PAPSO|nr:hypothetical protein C5167_012098 [Papaver somniferum]